MYPIKLLTMPKKTLLTLALFLFMFMTPFAHADEDFSKMNPTVKIMSHRYLGIDQLVHFSSGSGTVISEDGLLLSNYHVIFDEDEFLPFDSFAICITFDVASEPVCRYTAKWIWHDKDMDIALLQIDDVDIHGNDLPKLEYLDYKNSATPKEKDEVEVIGYPGSGGETITLTKGQISGFDTYNNFKYFKTDTDFDHGSSGGTVLDKNGNFIGIPTYIRTYAENVGYFLDLSEAEEWIDTHKTKSTFSLWQANDRINYDLKRLDLANESHSHTYESYPGLSISVPDDWTFLEIRDDYLIAYQESLTNPATVYVQTSNYQFEIDEGYLEALEEEFAAIKQYAPDYKKKEIKFAGKTAYEVSYTYYNEENHIIYIPHGYSLIGISYSIDKDEKAKHEAAISKVLSEIELTQSVQKDPNLSKRFSMYPPGFAITMPENWAIQLNNNKDLMDLMGEGVQKGNYEGAFNIYYDFVPKDEKDMKSEDRLDDDIKYLGYGSKLLFKKSDVVMAGLRGYMISYEYEGDEFQESRKNLTIKLETDSINRQKELIIEYDDLAENYDANLEEIKTILYSFEYNYGTPELPGTFDLGSLTDGFTDIQYHRYAKAITEAANKGIISGYYDGTFRPENPVNRAETLKIILESKNYLDTEKGLGKEVDFDKYAVGYPTGLSDVDNSMWFKKYVSYAKRQEIISGYADNTFKPNNKVNFAEALKMVINVYDISIWEGQTNPWYKTYLDKAYQMGWIPRGMNEDPGHDLTRAELVYIINSVYNQAK